MTPCLVGVYVALTGLDSFPIGKGGWDGMMGTCIWIAMRFLRSAMPKEDWQSAGPPKWIHHGGGLIIGEWIVWISGSHRFFPMPMPPSKWVFEKNPNRRQLTYPAHIDDIKVNWQTCGRDPLVPERLKGPSFSLRYRGLDLKRTRVLATNWLPFCLAARCTALKSTKKESVDANLFKVWNCLEVMGRIRSRFVFMQSLLYIAVCLGLISNRNRCRPPKKTGKIEHGTGAIFQTLMATNHSCGSSAKTWKAEIKATVRSNCSQLDPCWPCGFANSRAANRQQENVHVRHPWRSFRICVTLLECLHPLQRNQLNYMLRNPCSTNTLGIKLFNA